MTEVKIVKGEKNQLDFIVGKERIKHENNIKKSLKTHGNEVKKELKKVITTGSRSGRVYFYRGSKHIASAPGEAPANRSGRLANSFRYKASVHDLIIGSTAFSNKGFAYPAFLENNMNRPFWNVTHERLAYRLQKDLQKL